MRIFRRKPKYKPCEPIDCPDLVEVDFGDNGIYECKTLVYSIPEELFKEWTIQGQKNGLHFTVDNKTDTPVKKIWYKRKR